MTSIQTPDLNRIPESVKRVHLIAVCGTGMGALACMLRACGLKVTGSDESVYPPMSHFLRDRGIRIFDGYDSRNLVPAPDLVVVGNAVSRGNGEAAAMLETGLPYCSMPQAINHFIAAGKKPILVTGTHGKTTTSSLIAWILHEAGFDPTYVIGGILKNFGSNYRLGSGDHIVIEGDEYDTAFFDKGPKFLHYDPLISVLTGIEFDHADIFSDLDHVKRAFDRFLSGLSGTSRLFVYDGNPAAVELTRDREFAVGLYGPSEASDWRMGRATIQPPWTTVDVMKDGRPFGVFRSRMVGEHNLCNILAAVAVGESLGISPESISDALESFQGIKRRQEIRGVKRGITVMDDFAHHPTAVRETIKAVKPFYPDGRVIAVFEPRTNSSMRDVFQSVYPRVFDGADMVCIRRPSRLDKIPPGERFSSEKLVGDLKERGMSAHYFPDTQSIIDFILETGRSGDLVLIMSNGGFDNIHDRLLTSL